MTTDLIDTALTHGARHMTTITPIIPTPEWTAAVRDRYFRGIDRLADRHRKAIALHKQGHTYEAIAARLGFATRQSAYYAVHYSATAQEMRANAAYEARRATESPKTTSDTCTDDADEMRAA